jgi:hypothetical protein
MSPKEFTAFRIEPEIMAGLRKVKERDLIPLSVQVDQALRAPYGASSRCAPVALA